MLRHLYLFAYFHRFGGELDDSLSFDPFAGQDQRRAAGYHEGMRHPWPYTPDTVAVKLVQSAIDIVTRRNGFGRQVVLGRFCGALPVRTSAWPKMGLLG